MNWLLVICICLAVPAYAGSSVSSISRLTPTASIAVETVRSVTLCLLPDVQNAVSSELSPTSRTDCAGLSGFCTGPGCDKSIYCDDRWFHTGDILMTNLAYSLTGQWSKIDYSGIHGNDNVVSKQDHPLDHGRCDIIISLGDMLDVLDGYESKTLAELDTLGEYGSYTYQLDINRKFWGIIKASGIPYLPLQGNHDPNSFMVDLYDRLDYGNEPWVYDNDGRTYAILVPNVTGKPFCVIGAEWYYAPDTLVEYTAKIAALVGCGGDYPTIISGHYQAPSGSSSCGGVGATKPGDITVPLVGISAACSGSPQAGTVGMGEIFMIAGGHSPTTGSSQKSEFPGLFGADADASVFMFFSNWQEDNRHNANIGGTGITPSDGSGTAYTVVTINPDTDRLCGHDWNPYWQTRGSSVTGMDSGAQYITTDKCFDFDFDARFP